MSRADGLAPMLLGRARALGKKGADWLASLDGLVASLEQKWGVRAGEAMPGGSHAFVAPAEDERGGQYVLKIELPDGDAGAFWQGVEALRLANGHGYAQIYKWDGPARATLLERLGPPLKTLGFAPERQMELLCAALEESWRLPTDGAKLPGPAESIAWFRGFIPASWSSLGGPFPAALRDWALGLLAAREARIDMEPRVLIHGDAHNNNLLRTLDGRGFKLIDPDGAVGEPACDLGVLMREWPELYREDPVGAGRHRCALLHRLTGADPAGIWAWGAIQCVSTALVCLQIGEKALARELLHPAEAWRRAGIGYRTDCCGGKGDGLPRRPAGSSQ